MPLNDHALTTYATVKPVLGLPDDTQQAAVERLINAASEAIERYCGRHFELAAVTERKAGHGTPALYLERTPVLSVTSVRVAGAAVADWELVDPETGLLFRAANWPWEPASMPSIVWPPLPGTERRNIEVTYTGGYVLPKDDTPSQPRTLPEDLEQACMDTVVTWWNRQGMSLDITLEQLGAAQESYGRGQSGLPEAVLQLLAPWRRIV